MYILISSGIIYRSKILKVKYIFLINEYLIQNMMTKKEINEEYFK